MSSYEKLIEMGFPDFLVCQALIAFRDRPLEEVVCWLIENSEHFMDDIGHSGNLLADSSDTPYDHSLSEEILAEVESGSTTENGSINSKSCSRGDMLVPVSDNTETTLSVTNLDPLKSANNATSSNVINEKQDCDTSTNIKCLDCGLVMYAQDLEFHAVKSLHENFEETSEKVKELTEDEKKEAVKRLEDKIKQRRLESQEKQKQEEIEKEKARRKMGQDISTARAKFEENETQRQIELHRKEKREAELERQRVRAEIERDKEARRLEKESKLDVKAVKKQDVPMPTPTRSSEIKDTTCRLQMRLSNGETLVQTFDAKETLAAVRVYIDLHRTDGTKPYDLMVAFPKFRFSENDMMRSLSELGLCPSAAIFIKPKD